MLRNFEWPVRLMSGEPYLSAIFACGFSLLVLVLSAGGIFYFGFDVAESGNEQTVQSGSARDIVVHLRGSLKTNDPSDKRDHLHIGGSLFQKLPVERPVFKISQTKAVQKENGRFRLIRAETGQVIASVGKPRAQNPANRKQQMSNETYLSTADRQQERVCLAKAVYFEAGRDTSRAKAALAHLILNRVRSPKFPSTICGVVFQDEHRKNQCSFPFVCTGEPQVIKDVSSYKTAESVAYKVLDGSLRSSEIGASLRFRKATLGKANSGRSDNAIRIGRLEFF